MMCCLVFDKYRYYYCFFFLIGCIYGLFLGLSWGCYAECLFKKHIY